MFSPRRVLPRRALVGACAIAALSLMAACNKPASLAFSPSTTLVIESEAPVSPPPVVALTKDGQQLDTAPATTLAVVPDDIVNLEGGRLVPMKNGKAVLTATARDLPPAQLEVVVQIIDEMKVQCATSCDLGIGETAPLQVQATGLGALLNDMIVWTSDNPAVATVEADGKVTGVAAGSARITARIASKSAEVTVAVRPTVDEARLVCPWPPLLAVWKRGAAPVPLEGSCEVSEGDAITLTATFMTSQGPRPQDELVWKTSDPSVRVANGTVNGDRVGGAMVEVRLGDVAVEMPISVQKPSRPDAACPTEEEAFMNEATAKLNLSSASGATFAQDISYRCTSPAAQTCIDDGVAAIDSALKGLRLDVAVIEEFAVSALEQKARRCCCRR